MNTIIKKIDRNHIQPEDFTKAAKVIRAGGLVAFPTETVYGLGGDAFNKDAIKRIYEAKGRPDDNPLIVHITDMKELLSLVKRIPDIAYQLAEKFWPGPLTMIFEKSDKVPFCITGGLNTVAVRMPSDIIAKMLISESGCLIAAPSANSSGKPSTTKAEHVICDLNGKIEMILDGGLVEIGLESTIVDLTGEVPMILRPGYITKDDLESVAQNVLYDRALLSTFQENNIVAKAPGMKYKHYAPKADLIIYEGSRENVAKAINDEALKKGDEKKLVGIIATEETIKEYQYGIVKSVGSRKDELSITSRLFDLLREFDDLKVSFIYTESFEQMHLGQAIMNRLLKAAGYQVVHV